MRVSTCASAGIRRSLWKSASPARILLRAGTWNSRTIRDCSWGRKSRARYSQKSVGACSEYGESMMPRFVWVFALGAFLTGQAVCQNPRQPMDAYQVKAAFVLNFARFVQWPDDATGSADPFAICVMGRNPFGR